MKGLNKVAPRTQQERVYNRLREAILSGQFIPGRPVTLRGVAEMLGVSLRHVRRLDSSGKLPSPVRIGGSVRWSVEAINAWLQMDCPDRRDFEARLKAEGGGNGRAK